MPPVHRHNDEHQNRPGDLDPLWHDAPCRHQSFPLDGAVELEASGNTPTRSVLGSSSEQYTRCVAVMKSSSFASKMLSTYFCGLRSTSGNHVLCTCTMMR